MKDLFGGTSSEYENFTLFQDEAGCEVSNFFYHGYLLVKNRFGRQILDDLIRIKGKKSKDSEITFKEIKKDDYRVPITMGWLRCADNWLQDGKIRFYVLGINKNHLKDFWSNSWGFNKNVYLRFFEIGINSLLGWFGKNDPSLCRLLKVSHIFYEYGPYPDERKNKIKWVHGLAGYKNAEPVYSDSRKQKIENEKYRELSNLVQFTDILLGVTKYSFIKIPDHYVGRQKCVDCFIDIIERFNNKNAYNPNSRYYKRYALQFFPTHSDITKEEFLSGSLESFRKRGNFYNNRLTYRQQIALNANPTLF